MIAWKKLKTTEMPKMTQEDFDALRPGDVVRLVDDGSYWTASYRGKEAVVFLNDKVGVLGGLSLRHYNGGEGSLSGYSFSHIDLIRKRKIEPLPLPG
jgi:hypothetical protein